MFAIKHVNDNGHETMTSVHTFTYYREEKKFVGYGPDKTPIQEWSSGRIYAMNENGQTVGVYVISVPAVGVKAQQ